MHHHIVATPFKNKDKKVDAYLDRMLHRIWKNIEYPKQVTVVGSTSYFGVTFWTNSQPFIEISTKRDFEADSFSLSDSPATGACVVGSWDLSGSFTGRASDDLLEDANETSGGGYYLALTVAWGATRSSGFGFGVKSFASLTGVEFLYFDFFFDLEYNFFEF